MNLVFLKSFHSPKAARTRGMSRYEDTKPLVDQLPFVNVVKPAVSRIMIQAKKATGVEYCVQLLCHGSEDSGMFCFFIARIKRQ